VRPPRESQKAASVRLFVISPSAFWLRLSDPALSPSAFRLTASATGSCAGGFQATPSRIWLRATGIQLVASGFRLRASRKRLCAGEIRMTATVFCLSSIKI
jgi:hypothetical protein